MEDKVLFVIGPPRSGSTLLARMIGAHSLIYGRPEPHLLTPLAHLGYYAKVDKAPYDAVLAAEAAREFVADLPGGEQDYIDACRAYCDTLYHRMLATKPEKRLFLDKTPAYALVLDFIARIYPTAKYVVLTRHPLAVFSSYAESFFNGDYAAAQAYNPILERYVPALAHVPARAARCRSTTSSTSSWSPIPSACWPRSSPSSASRTSRRRSSTAATSRRRRGSAIRSASRSTRARPPNRSTSGRSRSPPVRIACELCRQIIARLDPDDLAIWGHPIETLWQPLEAAGAAARRRRGEGFDRYRLERLLIVKLRALVQRRPLLRRWLGTVRLGADVLLRE